MGKRISGAITGAAAGFAYGGPWGAVVGAVVGGIAGDQAEKADEKREAAQARAVEDARRARAINNAQQALDRNRQVRQAIAQQRVLQAQIIQRAQGGGGPQGVGQSLTGDLATSIGAANTQEGAAWGISQAQDSYSRNMMTAQSSNQYDVNAATISTLGNVAGSAYQQGYFNNLFNSGGGGGAVFANESAGAVSGGR